MKKLLYLALLFFVATACCEDEPVIYTPIVTPTAPILTGIVTTNGGELLEGATITISNESGFQTTVTTDKEGRYSTIVPEGKFLAIAECTNDPEREYSHGELTFEVAEGDVHVWNVLLARVETKEGDALVIGSVIEVDVPTIVVAEMPATIADSAIMIVEIPAHAVPENDYLIMDFYFDTEILDVTRGMTKMVSLLKVDFSLYSGNELLLPVNVKVPVPAEPVEARLNGEPIDYTFDGENIYIVLPELGLLTLNYYIDVTESEYTEPLIFIQDYYDNLYGSDEIVVTNPQYRMKMGGTVKGNHVLITSLASVYTGITSLSETIERYPIEITIPVGTSITLSGVQNIKKTRLEIADGLLWSEVIEYGSAGVKYIPVNRYHNGGSN